MMIDNLNRPVFMNDVQVELTGKEFAFDDRNIMSFISKLRKKIEPDPEHPFYILTVRGVGYRFNMEA